MVDYLILIVLLIVFNILFTQAVNGDNVDNTSILVGIYVLVQFALIIFYHLFFEFLWNGQTPGKRLFKMRVVQTNGMPATTTGLLIRNIVRLFDFLPFFYGIGLPVMFLSRRSQRPGDIAGRTLVVYEREQLTLDSLRRTGGVRYRFVGEDDPIPDFIDVGKLHPGDYQTLIHFLQRRGEITRLPYVTRGLTRKFAQKLGIDLKDIVSSPISEDTFLEQIARAFEREGRPAL